FGVAHGGTVHGLLEGYQSLTSKMPYLHLFDSFQGLPAEDPGIEVPAGWDVGAFASPLSGLERRLVELGVTEDQRMIHPGWFSETLKPELVANGTFKPAAYVDIDADLYNSTMDVLSFLFSHKLIRPGTLIGYDDWGDTELWTAGESRAHKEIMEKYDVACAQHFSWGERSLIRMLVVVCRVDRQSADRCADGRRGSGALAAGESRNGVRRTSGRAASPERTFFGRRATPWGSPCRWPYSPSGRRTT